jgi:transposase
VIAGIASRHGDPQRDIVLAAVVRFGSVALENATLHSRQRGTIARLQRANENLRQVLVVHETLTADVIGGHGMQSLTPIQRELRTLLQRAGRKSTRTREHRVFANKLITIWPALWTFATTAGVDPTNNAAERSLRGPVIHRKLSHGTRSDDGERFIKRALSASVTCRLQRRSLFAYLRDLLTARNRGDPLPTLA